jgi:hypothetical protein
MDILSEDEIETLLSQSKILARYNKAIDSQSAYEILNEKLEVAAAGNEEMKEERDIKRTTRKEETIFDNPMVKQMGRTAASVITRSLLGVLGLGGSTRRRRSLF